MNDEHRPSAQDAHLIERPERQSKGRRNAFGLLTAIAWAIYAYLWLPLVTLLAWWLGVKTAYVELYLREQRIDTFLILVVPLIIVVVAVLLLGWAEYNRHRFQSKHDRREPMPEVTHAEIAVGMGAPHALADALQQARSVSVAMDENAVPVMLTSDPRFERVPARDLSRPSAIPVAVPAA